MEYIVFLLVFPLLVSMLMLFVKREALRNAIVRASAIMLLVASVFMFAGNLEESVTYHYFDGKIASELMFYVELALGAYIFYLGIRNKRFIVSALITLQVILSIYYETSTEAHTTVGNYFYVDKFSIIMVLIIGVIGSLICIYALGYMKDFHHHHTEIKDNRSQFFFIMFVFLSAMFGIVLSNNLMWIFFFWEITTLSSFILIGYTKTTEAMSNSFRAITMNLLGGLAFMTAIIYLSSLGEVIELSNMITTRHTSIAIIPAALIAFAGLTKAAQMPFSSWLLGAMVAPTPVSALLHSSTMVKAGVYIIIRVAPILEGSIAGFIVTLIGGITFLLASCIAVSQSNAKKLLAYSTIANLGLIVACGGIGTYESIWAATLLVIFHATAKSLLFLCVGTIEHSIGSRDIEDMDGLIRTMPRMAVMLVIGIAGMFLAPFGMLISKWAALKAFIDFNPIMALLLAFGSAPTLFFWTKWLGKITTVIEGRENIEGKVNKGEWMPLFALAFLTILVCAIFPLISTTLVEPFLRS
ncbi:MAG TPA: proton-conducting transporter membrane subunit, partial [Patescibacteria group bacterium]|nr:proton-conducting transporter membrane subunit [Patescibacteria group bacterium]